MQLEIRKYPASSAAKQIARFIKTSACHIKIQQNFFKGIVHVQCLRMVYYDMIVWNGGKLKSHKIQDLCLMLNSTLHKSFLSTLLIIHRRCTFISAIPIECYLIIRNYNELNDRDHVRTNSWPEIADMDSEHVRTFRIEIVPISCFIIQVHFV